MIFSFFIVSGMENRLVLSNNLEIGPVDSSWGPLPPLDTKEIYWISPLT